ncbi:hypothetical protein BH11PSE10_BH11PSE10_12080 [soil metagenome]
MRLAWSAAALLALLRRWAGFVLVVAAVLGIGYFVAAIGWPALPVLWASSLPPAAGLAVLTAHAGIATALSWALREALLPAHWLLAERALPLRPAQRSAADLAVVALAQGPLFLLYAGSLLSWRHVDPAWLRGHWPRGLLFMAGSVLLSLGAATGLLALRRRQGHGSAPRSPTRTSARPKLRAWTALLVLPLWRGPARPVAFVLLLTVLVQLGLLAAVASGRADLRWCLAGYALFTLAGCSQAHARALRCYAPLIAAGAALPLAARAWPLRLRLLALTPVMLSWPWLLAVLLAGPWGPSGLSVLIAPAYLLAAWLAPSLQLVAPSATAEARAARWLLALAVWVALATEILAP